MLRKQRRFDRKNVIARDVPGRVNAFENDMQRGRVAFGDIRHPEFLARLCPSSNVKFKISHAQFDFQKLIDALVGTAPVRSPRERIVAGRPLCSKKPRTCVPEAPAMIAHHHGLFAFNTLSVATEREKKRRLYSRSDFSPSRPDLEVVVSSAQGALGPRREMGKQTEPPVRRSGNACGDAV